MSLNPQKEFESCTAQISPINHQISSDLGAGRHQWRSRHCFHSRWVTLQAILTTSSFRTLPAPQWYCYRGLHLENLVCSEPVGNEKTSWVSPKIFKTVQHSSTVLLLYHAEGYRPISTNFTGKNPLSNLHLHG